MLINAKDHDYLHYTDVTSALDYKWTGVMDMEQCFLIEDAMTGCSRRLTGGNMLKFNQFENRHPMLKTGPLFSADHYVQEMFNCALA